MKNKQNYRKKLATIYTEAPIEITLDDLDYPGPNEEEVLTVWQELGFKSLIEKSNFADDRKGNSRKLQFEIVTDVTEEMLTDEMAVHVEIENEHYHDCQIFGIALTDGYTYIIYTN